MNEIMAIAGGTWRKILRMRVVYFLVICVWIIIGSMVNYDILSMGEEKMLMIDVSLVLNTIAAILVAISITFEIPKELREGVASTLLTKPLGRTQYLVGKLVGTIVAGVAITGLIAIGSFLIYSMSFNQKVAHANIQGQLLVIFSVLPMTSIAVLFSIFVPEMLAALITAGIIWAAHSTSHLLSKIPILYGGIIPDLNLFNLKAAAVYNKAINWDYLGLSLLWGIIFSVFAISLASLIFRQKDLR